MPLPHLDGTVGQSLGLEIEGVQIKQVQVSGLKMEQDVIELKDNRLGSMEVSSRVVGRPKPGEVTLTHALTDDTSFEKWVNAARSGTNDARKGGTIIVFDAAGSAFKRFKLTNCWPKSLEIGAAQVGDTSVLTEKLVITFESLEPE